MRQYKTELSIIFILLFIWGAEFFVLDILPQLKAQAAEPPPTPQVVINEIAWMGTKASYNDEWIELFNNSDINIDLSGWILQATDSAPRIELSGTIPTQGYFLLERTDDNTISDISTDQFYTGALFDDGEHLVLLDNNSTIIDELDNSGGWAAGDKNNRLSMERIDNLKDANDPTNWANNDQKIFNGKDATGNSIFGTPKQKNSVSYPKEEEPPSEENPIQDTTPAVNFILINELLPDPVGDDHEGEYIELFNNSDTTADISLWELKDETKKEKSQSGFVIEAGTTMPAFSYRAFYTGKKISLNNDGDTVYLYNPGQTLKDQRVYTGKIPQGESYNRQDDNTWAWSTTTTPGTKNEITTKDTNSADPAENKSYPRHIWINEFFPNPKGKDAENEFIEIYNPGPAEIDLTAWQIDDQENKGSHPYIFPENFIIKRGEYVTLPYSQTKISLNNNDDWVRLLWPDGQAIDEVPYSDPPEGESYNKTNNGWRWSCAATPGEPNKIASRDECAASPEEEIKNYSRALWINEFLPDPKGKDEEGEFIELQNRGEEEIDLTAWQIDDCENTGSRPHAFPENTKIKADSYLVIYYKEAKISLNNNGDCVRLLNPAGQAVDEIKYGKAKEGQSYSRQNVDHWQWTDNPTPGKDNEFPQILAAKNSITKNNQPLATTPKRQILPQTGPNMYFYYSPVFLFFFIFYLTKIKKYYKNRNCSFIKST